MGQKVNPTAFRTGVIFPTKSIWFSSFKDYAKNVLEEFKLREFLNKKLTLAGLTKIEIKRSINSLDIFLHVSRPGVVIGRGGSGLDQLKRDVVTSLWGICCQVLIF
jgi:small subunit ribosomal protein S3